MVISCAAYGCTNRQKKGAGISFHSFPSDKIVRQQWIVAMKRENFEPSKYSKLCSEHFQNDDFVFNFGLKTLKPGVIPTIFKFPPHLIKKAPKKRSARLQTKEIGDQPSVSCLVTSVASTSKEEPKQCAAVSDNIDMFQDSSCKLLPSLECRKRKRTHPVYMGDLTLDDLNNPKKVKIMWDIATKTINRQKRRISYLQTKVCRLQKRIKSLNDLVDHLKNTNRVSSECHSLLQECIPSSEKQLLLRQLKLVTERKFPPDLRIFALTLHFYSSSAYNYVRKCFGNCLPHPNTIRKWYSTVDGSPGYTSESLNAIQMKADELKKEGKELVCSLIMDEMAIREHVDWNGSRSVGYVNFGVNIESDSLPLAKEALAFLIVGVNCRWKIPIAYFLLHSIAAEGKANLVKGCLFMLQKAGARVISLTFDGAATNWSMASILGADFTPSVMKTYFLHPATQEEVFIIFDPCHVIKLIRNALGDWEAFDENGRKILWQFFKDLVTLQENQELHLATKIRRKHINYHNEKMKVKLAVQLFSTSVADALEYCDKDLELPQFHESEATVTFCRTLDKLFDVFNTRNFLSRNPFKKPLSVENFSFVKSFFNETRKYILDLKNLEGEQLVYSRRKKGFLGLLINMSSIESIIEKFIIEKKYLSYLLTYKLSQDHIETFFCAIRSRGGFNNNPTASQFEAAYKRLLIHAEIGSKSSANCLPQDDTYILNVASTKSSQKTIISDTNVDTLDDGETQVDTNEIFINNENCQYTTDVVTYICGFVVRKLKLRINCPECCSQLESDITFSKLIKRKDRGGLIKPSASVIKVCRIAETVFRNNKNISTGNVILKLIYLAKKQLDIANVFPGITNHILDQDPLNNHLLQMINLILKFYFTIRLHHKNMQINQVKDRIRHKYSKLILFKHQ